MTGRCLCGAVRYAVRGKLRDVLVCHCVECRRWTGRAWPATAARRAELELVEARGLRWIASPSSVSRARRGFCAECGTCLFWDAPGRDTVSISAGSLDEPAALHVAAHIWVAQAEQWEPPPGDMPSHPRGYPADAPPLSWRSAPEATGRA